MEETDDEPVFCSYCGARIDGTAIDDDNEFLECPECGRDGCLKCIPGGKGVICPECETGDMDNDEEDN
jgi:hypothetical protein